MSRLGKIMQWTLQNDLTLPFLEIILFLAAYEAITDYTILGTDALTRYTSLTWNMIYVIIFLSAIGGVRVFSMAVERGEVSRQLVDSGSSRHRFILSKFASFYITTLLVLLIADVVALLVYMGYFFDISVYTVIGTASLLNWAVMIAGQMLLLFFLDSLIMSLSLFFRSATVSILIFLAVTVLGVSLYTFGLPSWAKDLQLGFGDYEIANKVTAYAFYTVIRHASNLSVVSAAIPNLTTFYGILYRLVGGIALFIAGVFRFNTMDLD
jgi:hypothetical protein